MEETYDLKVSPSPSLYLPFSFLFVDIFYSPLILGINDRKEVRRHIINSEGLGLEEEDLIGFAERKLITVSDRVGLQGNFILEGEKEG